MSSPKKRLIIIGLGGHAISAWDLAIQMDFQVIAFISPTEPAVNVPQSIREVNLPIFDLGDAHKYTKYEFFVAVGDNNLRFKIASQLKESGCQNFPNIVSVSASISKSVTLGEGNFIGNQVNIGPFTKIGHFNIVNSSSTIDHEGSLENFISLAPGVITGGGVKIKSKTFVGMNSAIRQNLTVGANCLIGASSYVNAPLPDDSVAWGVPAKVKRSRAPDEKFKI